MAGQRDVNAKKDSINYKIRLTVQTLIFAAFICLLVYADPIAEKDGAVDIFLRMSPGDDSQLENNWSGKRNKALSSMLAVLAQDLISE